LRLLARQLELRRARRARTVRAPPSLRPWVQVQVLVASLLFIGFVTTLHIMGKLLSFTTRK